MGTCFQFTHLFYIFFFIRHILFKRKFLICDVGKVIFGISVKVILAPLRLLSHNLVRELKQAGPREWIQSLRRTPLLPLQHFSPQQYGRLPVQAESSPPKDHSKNSQGAWQMGKQNRVHSVCCWCHHWTWECLEISIHVLQERWRYVTFFFFFSIVQSAQCSFLILKIIQCGKVTGSAVL